MTTVYRFIACVTRKQAAIYSYELFFVVVINKVCETRANVKVFWHA